MSERTVMEENKAILIADRNPHIRGLLRRELTACGYPIRLVQNGKELLSLIYSPIPIALLVLDPDFPGVESIVLARKIADRVPQLPVILHSIRGSDTLDDFSAAQVFHVEKNGQSIETLKTAIHTILSR
ncbi:MAG: response regulator [Desulfosarcina sp.]